MRTGRLGCFATTGLALVVAGCGGGSHSAPSAPAAAPGTCATALARVAQRVYAEAQSGANAREATKRLERSTALGDAVARGDRAGVRRELAALSAHQIVRAEVSRGGHVLARWGSGQRAIAPRSGPVRTAGGRTAGRFTLSVAGERGLKRMIRTLTGATVSVARLRAGAAVVPPGGLAAFSATAYPAGRLQVTLARPATSVCGPTSAATLADVARRVLAAEEHGSAVHRVLRHVAADPGFKAAVAADDPVRLRAAIVRAFRDPSLHVVRIRAVQSGGRLVGDVGGPYVIAPVSGPVRGAGGRRIGTVTLSIQDDTGYMKLVRAFTGERVALVGASGTVPGSDAVTAPTAFRAPAFPAGTLEVRLTS